MSSIFDGIDITDPCAMWPKLQEVADRLVAGEMVVRARFGEEERQYQHANIPELKRRIRELKLECARQEGKAAPRRAITFG